MRSSTNNHKPAETEGSKRPSLAGEPGGLWVPGQDPGRADGTSVSPTGLWIPRESNTGRLIIAGAGSVPAAGGKTLEVCGPEALTALQAKTPNRSRR